MPERSHHSTRQGESDHQTQGREGERKGMEWGGRLEMMRENPPNRCRDETENEGESGCRNSKRL